MQQRRNLVWGFLLAMFLLFTLGSRTGVAYVNLLWYRSLGLASVFWRVVTARVEVGVAAGLAVGVFLLANLLVARPAFRHVALENLPPQARDWLHPRRLAGVMAVLSAVAGALAGWSLSTDWLVVWRYLDRQPFGLADPLFHRDAGFFVFQLPFYDLAYQSAGLLLALALLAAAAVYFATGLISYFAGRLQVHPRARAHLATLLAAYLALKSFGYVLGAWELDFSPRGVVFGASYADVHAQLPAQRILTVLALAAAFLALLNARWNLTRWLVAGVGGLAAASLLLGAAWPALTEEFVVKPSEITREAPYIRDNIRMTRAAFGLRHVQHRTFDVRQDLTPGALRQYADTIQSIRLWDWRVASAAFQQLQSLRTYYSFDPMTVDRYTVDGHLRQVLVSAREIRYPSLPEQTWVNRTIKYTHGYGAVVVPASVIGPSGLPDFWLKGFPPAASSPAFELKRPDIYYGEQTSRYVFVDTSQPEFDYPQGQQNRYTTYRGTGGVPVGSTLNRVALAFWAGNYNILFSSYFTPASRVLIYRNIRTRVRRIAPFLAYDRDPYLVIAGGRLFWIQDAYTTSDRFPYSQRYPYLDGQVNYMRNSVKVVTDAYDGTTTFYAADPRDPILRDYERIFPGLFHPLSAMPPDLRAHLRYPEDLFSMQMQVYAKYHMTDPVVFYNREDLWAPAKEQSAGTGAQVTQPYYVIIQLPGEKSADYLLMEPMTPFGKDNMVAWVAGRWVQGPGGGLRLLAYEFPKGRLIFGPLQVESRITQNPTVAQDITLWSQQGSTVIRGNLLVIPIRNSLLYVEPLYQLAAQTNLPELRRVIIGYGDRIVLASDLRGALDQLFPPGGQAPAPAVTPPQAAAPAPPAPKGPLPQQALQLYQEAMAALKNGDFATFGQRLDQLGKVLGQMSRG